MPYGTIGKLDRRITIQTPTTTRGIGGSVKVASWSNFATVWSSFSPLSGGEGYVDDQTRNKSRAMFGIRYLEGIRPDMRILFEGQTWRIVSALPTERNRSIDIEAEIVEYVPGGE